MRKRLLVLVVGLVTYFSLTLFAVAQEEIDNATLQVTNLESSLSIEGNQANNRLNQPEESFMSVVNDHPWQFLTVTLFVIILFSLALIFTLRKMVRSGVEKLAASEDMYRNMIETSPEPVLIHRNGTIVYLNPASMKLLGISSEADVIGKNILQFIHPSDHEMVSKRVSEALKQSDKKLPLIEEKLLKLDGTLFWAEVTAISILYKGEQSIMVLIHDVTERKQAKEKSEKSLEQMGGLRQTLERLNQCRSVDEAYQTVVKNIEIIGCDRASLCIFDGDNNLHLAAWNGLGEDYLEAVNSYTPWQRSESSAKPICITNIPASPLPEPLKKATIDEGIQSLVFFPLTVDGGILGEYIAYYNQLHETSVEEVDLGEILIDDFVETLQRIEYQVEKEVMQRQVEHAQRLDSLGVLAGGIAHDFNNILTAVMGNASLAERHLSSDPISSKEHLNKIVRSSEKAALLCKQMLAYSGKGQFIIKALHLSAMVHDITSLLEVSIERGVELKFNLDDHLPLIEADESQLQQVIMNLVMNASDSIQEKNGQVTITTGVMDTDAGFLTNTLSGTVLSQGRYVFLKVSDTGCGMNEEEKNKIFEPFFTTKFTGRGLGMSAVLGIMRSHNGAIYVESEEGRGTMFKLLFPISDKVEIQDTVKDLASDGRKASGCILVIDDDEIIREVAVEVLEDMGFTTKEAVDGEDGVNVYRKYQHEVDAVLLDMTMPKLNGAECYKELCKINEDVVVVISSGYNEDETVKQFEGKGIAAFVQKPYLPELLEETLLRVTRS